jgi:hypothetical protein
LNLKGLRRGIVITPATLTPGAAVNRKLREHFIETPTPISVRFETIVSEKR